jgi:glycine cleavage system H protein
MVAAGFLSRFGILKAKQHEKMRSQNIAEPVADTLKKAREILYHQGHTWVKFMKSEIAVGIDDFTKRFVGKIDRIEIPAVGTKVDKGKTLWTINFGGRTFSQVAPVSGRITEVNEQIVSDPSLIQGMQLNNGWIVKIVPEALGNDVLELHAAELFEKLTDNQIAKYFKGVFPNLGMVYGDGGEIVPGAAALIQHDKWDEFAKKFFQTE